MTLQKNIELKKKIFEIGATQREIARKAGINERILSLIIHGRYNPDEDEARKIASTLGVSVNQLFTE